MADKVQQNWMSTVDSPTYNFSLYLVDTDVHNTPTRLLNDSPVLNSGKAVKIAESGTTTKYAIENILMSSIIVPGQATGNSSTGVIQFELLEVLGFSLFDDLMRLSHRFNFQNVQNALYVLKLQFKGVLSGSSVPTKFPGVFFYPISFNDISATLGPEGARYSITANTNPKTAIESTTIEKDITVNGIKTAGNFAINLQNALNNYEEELRKSEADQASNPKKRYQIVFTDEMNIKYGSSVFASAMSGQTSGTGSMDELEAVSISVAPNSNIPSFIRETLTKELTDLQKSITNTEMGQQIDTIKVTPSIMYMPSTDVTTNQKDQIITLTVGFFKSYFVEPEDAQQQEEFTTSSRQQQQYFQRLKNSLYKRYDYLYTGLNTEILDVSLQYNLNYFNELPPSGFSGYTNPSATFEPRVKQSGIGIKILGNMFRSQDNDVVGAFKPNFDFANPGAHAQRVTSDTGSDLPLRAEQADAYSKIVSSFMDLQLNIKGDPYWLGTPGAELSITGPRVTNLKHGLDEDSLVAFINYLPDESMASTNRQKRGRLDIASSGVYRVNQITSRFTNGKFSQELACIKEVNLTTSLVASQLQLLGARN
jgi:hypothetical protein